MATIKLRNFGAAVMCPYDFKENWDKKLLFGITLEVRVQSF